MQRVFNFSGGKTSAYMVIKYWREGDLVIFTDTGREHPKTYKFINDFEAFEKYYPEYYNEASKLSERLGKYWGRSVDDFHISFGRELGQESTCETCEW